ncbi:MAG TPA: hypothetical protein VIM59_01485 [Cellvibrio sp.]
MTISDANWRANRKGSASERCFFKRTTGQKGAAKVSYALFWFLFEKFYPLIMVLIGIDSHRRWLCRLPFG